MDIHDTCKREVTIRQLFNLCEKLLVPISTATSVIYIAHRYIDYVGIRSYLVLNRAEFLATIIFLGCKADECPKSLRSVISVVWRFLDIQIAEKYLESRYAEFKTIVVKKEQEILRILGFNTTVDHPHKYLLNFARSLNISCEVVNISWSCLNDFMIIREFVLFNPYEISIACIYFGIHSIQKLHHNSQTELTSSDHEFLASKWWNQFGVNDSILCSILSLIVKYYQN